MDQYDLLLFDLDGLLVDTEEIHFRAYQKMCLQRGFVLSWDFKEYCSMAHAGSDFLQKKIYQIFPALYEKEPNWKVLYQEKKQAFLQLVAQGEVKLMPGVKELLESLKERQKRCVVVTHSLLELAKAIQEKIPLLKTIPHWVTRDDYIHPKPAPDPYLKALELYAKPSDSIVAFEDTVRGWKSLHQAGLRGIVISSCLSCEFSEYLNGEKVSLYHSFSEIFSLSLL